MQTESHPPTLTTPGAAPERQEEGERAEEGERTSPESRRNPAPEPPTTRASTKSIRGQGGKNPDPQLMYKNIPLKTGGLPGRRSGPTHGRERVPRLLVAGGRGRAP